MSNVVDAATDTANAMMTAAMLRDYEAFKTLVPDTRSEAFYTMVALARLGADSLERIATAAGEEDPLAYWQRVLVRSAAHDAL